MVRFSHLIRLALAVAFTVIVAVSDALAVTVRDIVELSKAGLSDEVLVALIETDGTVFTLDAAGILDIRAAGVSDKVIVAMLRQGRTPLPVAPAPPQADPPLEQPEWASPDVPTNYAPTTVLVVPTMVAVPFAVPFVPGFVPRGHTHRFPAGFDRFMNLNDNFVGNFHSTSVVAQWPPAVGAPWPTMGSRHVRSPGKR